MRSPVLLASTIALTTWLAGAAAQADNKVGVTAAVNPQAIGQPPSEPERILLVGTDNYANEKISTGPAGQVQLLFVDGTSISVGPDANLTIDQYVYDPSTKVGKLAVSATQGVFRFVGGAISKANEITLTTPIGTVGIRGGVALIGSHPTQGMTAAFIFGTGLRVTANNQTQEVLRPGFQITVLPGQPPGPPVRMTSADVRGSLAQFQGKRGGGQGSQGGQQGAQGGQQGDQGGQEPVQDQALDQSGLSQATGSNLAPQSLAPNAVNFNTVFNPNTSPTIQNITASAGTSSTVQQATQIPLFGAFFSETLYNSFDPTTGFATYNSNNHGLTNFFLNAGGTIGFTTPQGFAVSAPLRVGTFNVGYGVASVTTVIKAPNPAQFFAVAGQYTPNSGNSGCTGSGGGCGFFFFGGTPTQANASSAFPSSGFTTYSAIGVTTDPGKAPKVPFTAGLNTPAPGSNGLAVSNVYTVFGANQNPGTSNAGVQGIGASVQASGWIVGSGANQSSGLVGMTSVFYQETNSTVGMAGGVVGVTRDCAGCTSNRYGSAASSDAIAPTPGSGLANGNAIFGPNANYIVAGPDNVSANFAASGGANTTDTRTSAAAQTFDFSAPLQSNGPNFYGTVLQQAATGISSSTFAPRTDTTGAGNGYVVYTGGVMDVRSSNGSITQQQFWSNNTSSFYFTNPNTNTAGANLNFTDGSNNYSLKFGNITGNYGTRSAFIDDLTWGTREARDVNANPLSTFNGSPVAFNRLFMVPYTVAPIPFSSFAPNVTPCTCSFMSWGWWIGEVQNTSNPTQIERFNMATWVAGVLPSTAAVQALSGMSNYAGHAIGNVSVGSMNYIAAGNWSMTWNFSSRQAVSWQVNGFDVGGLVNSAGFSFQNSGLISAANGRDFSGGISGPGGSSGSAFGSFYKNIGNGDPAAGAAGSWTLANSAFKAAGTFIGKR